MWIVGGLSAFTYIIVILNSGLIAAMGLQFYYLGMSIYGWKMWGGMKVNEDIEKPVVSLLTRKIFIVSLFTSILGYFFLSYILEVYSEDPMPKVDALIASISMLATWWVTKKYIQNWILWLLADGIAVYLYISQELYATALLYFVYMAAAVAGYIHWRKFPKSLN
jgi:nicotinamide mononucleotide transporter